MGNMKCSQCNADLQPTAKFCGGCGKPVDINDHQEDLVQCPNIDCGAPQKKGMKYCSSCGKELHVLGISSPDDSTNKNNAAVSDELDGSVGNSPCQDSGDYGSKTKHTCTGSNTDKECCPTVEVSTKGKGNTRKGFAVISSHCEFSSNFNLRERPSAEDDRIMLEEVLKKYDCDILPLSDKTSKYYKDKFCENIKEKMKGEKYQYFLFALSTHGEEKEEKQGAGHVFNHYFYTRDGQYQTQQLMEEISTKLESELKDKMKIFIIQACRSRNQSDVKNLDIGVKVGVTSTEQSTDTSTSLSANDHSYSKETQLQRSLFKSIDVKDARGYMPPSEEEEEHSSDLLHPPMGTPSGDMETILQLAENEESTIVAEFIPVTAVPHCDDAVVVFASMSGKYAYSKEYEPLAGGWLIRTLYDVLLERSSEDEVHILDVLVDVNQRVSKREALLGLSTPGDYKWYLNILAGQQNEGNNNRELQAEVYEMIELVSAAKLGTNILEEELANKAFDLIRRVKKDTDFSGVKCQSCFFHNLAFDKDEDFHLKYVDS